MSGPFYVALVDPDETTFGPEHQVNDLDFTSFSLTHAEGDKAGLSLDVKNPGAGLLTIGSKQWLWFSWFDGATLRPLFFGRLLAFPNGMTGRKVTILFRADRADHAAQEAALADLLKVLPQYDPVFVDEQQRADLSTVLEGYSALWHYDRVTGQVTISDIINGEDGVEEFGADEVPEASVDTKLNQAPLTSIDVEMVVTWTQSFSDTVDLGSWTFNSYSGDGIINDWPKPQSSIAGGYDVVSATAVDVYGVADTPAPSWSYQWNNIQKEHINGDDLSVSESQTKPIYRGPFLQTVLTDKGHAGLLDAFADPPINIPATRQMSFLYVPKWQVQTSLVVATNPGRKRTERLRFTLQSDLQAIVADDGQNNVAEPLTLNGADVGVGIPDDSTDGQTPPLVDDGQRSYFPSDRGKLSIENGILQARAILRASARCVDLSFDCTFARGVNLSCRKNVLFHSSLFPGGQVSGKVTSYTLQGDGNGGNLRAKITAGCAVGKGNSVAAVDGTETYVDPGVLDPGIGAVIGDTILVAGEPDVGYGSPVEGPNDDGLVFPLSRSDIVISEVITGDIATQEAAIQSAFVSEQLIAQLGGQPAPNEQIALENLQAIAQASANSVANAIKNSPIKMDLTLRDLSQGGFETVYDLPITKLAIAKQIDLAAEAA